MMARAKRTRGQQQQEQQEEAQKQKQKKINDGKFSEASTVLNSDFARSAALLVEISQRLDRMDERLARMHDKMNECFDRIEKRMVVLYVELESALTVIFLRERRQTQADNMRLHSLSDPLFIYPNDNGNPVAGYPRTLQDFDDLNLRDSCALLRVLL